MRLDHNREILTFLIGNQENAGTVLEEFRSLIARPALMWQHVLISACFEIETAKILIRHGTLAIIDQKRLAIGRKGGGRAPADTFVDTFAIARGNGHHINVHVRTVAIIGAIGDLRSIRRPAAPGVHHRRISGEETRFSFGVFDHHHPSRWL